MNEHVTTIEFRVRYAETDQGGIAHHSNYLVWYEQARTDHLRRVGISYRDMEASGVLMVVVDARLRFRQPAYYDDMVRVSCWVRDVASRRAIFGFAVHRASDSELLATAQISLIAVDSRHGLARLPPDARQRLVPIPDPVRL
ncbi:MAG: thioesterase family protein [Gemmatimonadales bacterium]|jgi:acyl-CoA thioester hydrolase